MKLLNLIMGHREPNAITEILAEQETLRLRREEAQRQTSRSYDNFLDTLSRAMLRDLRRDPPSKGG